MTDTPVDVEAKVAEKNRQDREIADRRAQRRLQRKCFWTRPRRGCGGRGPWICAYPPAAYNAAGTRWRCPECGTTYKLTRPKPRRWWRNWEARHGHWRITLRSAMRGANDG